MRSAVQGVALAIVVAAASVLLARTGAGAAGPTSAVASPAVQRLAGADRYATAAAVSAAIFPAHPAIMFVATGATFPDALAAGPAAWMDQSPVLLVTRTGLPTSTRDELVRLQPDLVYVLGGTAVVSDSVVMAISNLGISVTRLAGADRYETATKVSAQTFAPAVPAVFIATGLNYPDALASTPAASRMLAPLLLVPTSTIPASVQTELTRLQPAQIFVIGGPSVVSDATLTALGAYTSGTVRRLAGADRYATSLAISQEFFDSAPIGFVATGRNFPDALAGGPAAAFSDGQILLVPGTSLPQPVADEITRIGMQRAYVLGGTASVSDPIITALNGVLP